MRILSLEHRFVRSVPRELEPGVLYVSMEYATAVHSCCCGCGEQVVTPLSPTDWKMIYDGESVSLTTSIGNWQLPCRSHYIIKRGHVIEAESWSTAQVQAEYRRDKAAKARFYHDKEGENGKQDVGPSNPEIVTESSSSSKHKGGFWSSLAKMLFGGPPAK